MNNDKKNHLQRRFHFSSFMFASFTYHLEAVGVVFVPIVHFAFVIAGADDHYCSFEQEDLLGGYFVVAVALHSAAGFAAIVSGEDPLFMT